MWVSDVPGASGAAAAQAPGQIAGQREGAQAGATILEAGGNAVDAIVTAAFTACVVAIPSCGIGGYGGHLVVASSNGRDVSSVDFNSEAPAAARPDMYPLGPDGKVVGNVQNIGWRSVGVPGTLAGLERALTRYGRLPLRDVLEPAIRYCRTGVPVGPGLARAIQNSRAVLSRDPGASALLLPGGEPPAAGSLLTNPALGELLATLAARNSVRSFYEGDIAVRLAEAFARHDGLVTAADLAAYQARDVKPLALRWGEYTIHTAPLTAGGLSVLQALQVLQAGDWPALAADSRRALHFRLEALRTVWHDRLALLGDPQTREVPTDRLLSTQYARETAARVGKAVAEGRQLAGGTDGRSAGGTIHLSAVDRDGSMAAMTLTHGEGFGGRVAAGELGLLLGHGLSRFDPHPEAANTPEPGKRPLNNMCPTVVLRRGVPYTALGAAGGRRIVTSVFEVLLQIVAHDRAPAAALQAPRLHTEGDGAVTVDAGMAEEQAQFLAGLGYTVRRGAMANVSLVTK